MYVKKKIYIYIYIYDEAQKAETVLSAVSHKYIYIKCNIVTFVKQCLKRRSRAMYILWEQFYLSFSSHNIYIYIYIYIFILIIVYPFGIVLGAVAERGISEG